MPRRKRWPARQNSRPGPPRPLLTLAARRLAAALAPCCVAVTAALGALFAHQAHAGWLDRAVDGRLQAALGAHRAVLGRVVGLGGPVPVTVTTVVLLLACLAGRRWRGAALLATAVPAAAALTELLLKPLAGRTLAGGLSFPSGHATGMFALTGAVAVLLLGPQRPRLPAALRVTLALCGYAAAAAVAVALVSLGLHYFTDTVGGAAVGTAVVLSAALILDRLGLGRRRQPVSGTCAAPTARPAPPGRQGTAGRASPAGGAQP